MNMDKNKKTIIFISIIVVLAIILGCLIKVAVTGTLFGSTNNSTEATLVDNNEVTSQSINIEQKTSDKVDLSSVTAKVDLSSLTSSGSGTAISGTTITITSAGTFYFSGTATEANIVVNAGDSDKVNLVFENANITSSKTAVINGINAKKITINLVEGSTNTFTDGSTYTVFTEDDEPNATVFSKTDLDINGTGTLTINANYEDAIASKDDLVIENATIKVTAKDDGIRGKDSVTINNANITVTSTGDAIKATNDTDSSKGYISINGGTFDLTSQSDGIQAETVLKITDGNFTIKTTGVITNDESYKALKAGTLMEISGGTFNINSTDDGIHSNGNISITGGDFTITSKDDGVHADGLAQIDNGTFNITAAEGIEATYVKINGGTINISASDDGINAGNKSSDYSVVIEINGGDITIKMGSGDTDAIDSNGNIYVNGGTINITGNSAFDYDGTAQHNGGTIIVNGTQTDTITNQFMGGGRNGRRHDARRSNATRTTRWNARSRKTKIEKTKKYEKESLGNFLNSLF